MPRFPTILKSGMRQGIETVGFLSVAPYLLAIILMVIVSHRSDRTLNRRRYVWPFLVLAALGLLGSYLTANHSFWLAYGFLVIAGGAMYAPYGPFFAILPEILPDNVAGEAMALVNSFGALGAFVGTWLVGLLQAWTGNSQAGFLFMSASLLLGGLLMLGLRQSKPALTPAT